MNSETEDLHQGPDEDEGLAQHLLLRGRGRLTCEDFPQLVGIIDDGDCDGYDAGEGDG